MPKQKLNIAMIGTGSMGKAHSNAFRQVTHFFDVPYKLVLKVVCGRNPDKLPEALDTARAAIERALAG